MLAINPKIKQKAEDIRKKIFGAEVRESLASGLEGMSEDVESIKGRQGNVEQQFQDVLDETTDKDFNSAPEIKAARNGKSNLKTRLDDEHAQVTAQLRQKADVTYVDQTISTMTNGAIKGTYTTLSALNSAYPQGAVGPFLIEETQHRYIWDVNKLEWVSIGVYEPAEIPDESITINKLHQELAEYTSNVFDKSKSRKGYFDYLGNVMPHSTLMVTDKITVDVGDVVNMTNARAVAQYGSDGIFIRDKFISESTTIKNYTFVVPQGTRQIAMTFDGTSINDYMVTINKPLPVEYTPYKFLNPNVIPDAELKTILNKVFERTNNFFDKTKILIGKWIQLDGTLADNLNLATTYRIPVVPGDVIRMTEMRTISQYNAAGKFIPEKYDYDTSSGVYEFTVPVGTYSFAVTFRVVNVDNFMITINKPLGDYEPYYKNIYNQKNNIYYDLDINLPTQIYATVGEELVIYNQNILKENTNIYNIDYDASIGKQMFDRYIVTPTSVGNVILTVKVYDKSNLLVTKQTTIVVSNPRTTPITVLEIGDSTTHAAANAYAVKRLKDKLGGNISLIGTQGLESILYEGRGGWKAETYRTNTEAYGKPNPFWNPTTSDFDFNYYMAQNGFSGVDVVIINLGINDVFGQKGDSEAEIATNASISNTDFIINSIKNHGSEIKIAINITIPPNSDQDVFGNNPDTALYQTQWRAKYNNFIYSKKLIDHYQGQHDLIPIHAVIDTVNNIDDHVHPKELGYYQIGDQKYNYLNSLQ